MENMLDRRTDLLKETFLRVRKHIKTSFKNTDPYRKVKMSDEEALYEYMNLDPEVKESLRMEMPEVWGKYEEKILELGGKYDTRRIV